MEDKYEIERKNAEIYVWEIWFGWSGTVFNVDSRHLYDYFMVFYTGTVWHAGIGASGMELLPDAVKKYPEAVSGKLHLLSLS